MLLFAECVSLSQSTICVQGCSLCQSIEIGSVLPGAISQGCIVLSMRLRT